MNHLNFNLFRVSKGMSEYIFVINVKQSKLQAKLLKLLTKLSSHKMSHITPSKTNQSTKKTKRYCL